MTNKALLVQENEDESKDLLSVLTDIAYANIRVIPCTGNIAHVANEFDPDVVLIDVFRPRTALLEKVAKLNANKPVPIIMFVDESSDEVIAKVIGCGIAAYIVDGYQRERVRGIIQLARVRFDENQRLLNELDTAKSALTGRKLIDRAKGLVMKQKNCNEETAYQLIRKMAMNKNVKIEDIARQVIELAELMQ